MKKITNKDLGWCSFFEKYLEDYKDKNFVVMRIVRENRAKYIACNEMGQFLCEPTGKFKFKNEVKNQLPVVGDWVVASIVANETKAMIHAVLPRKSVFSRKVAGKITQAQPVVANIDIIFIVIGLDFNYNLRRIERYLSLAWNSGAVPVVLLNKTDLCPKFEERKYEVECIAKGVDVIVLSAFIQKDLEKLKKYIKSNNTMAFLGSSGVGKSTIINALLGIDRFKVNETSDLGSRGRHTTTFRELVFLPDGGMVIDTPGMREIQVWGDESGLDESFNDIKELANNCRFKDCRHQNEPGCAVKEAINKGNLDKKRFENYLKLEKEFAYLTDRQTMKASAVEKARWKTISEYAKKIKKNK